MEQKFFLERNRSEFSNDVERSINVDLSTKTRSLPNDNISDEFSLFEQYNRERDECGKIRLILNVNPICSNVLYNMKTEIVINEGSSACTSVIGENDGGGVDKRTYAPNAVNTQSRISRLDAIRNTEYSHKENGGFVYHCGVDIFNNHMLRKKDFVHVNKLEEGDGDVYNTIKDYCRDGRGQNVTEEIGIKTDKSRKKTKMHLYQYDSIMSMPMAFMDNCIEKDGWWGFTNPNTIEIPNNSGDTISINKMMANNKACEFIDLYPDRSLFSFIPKFNKFRRRTENNWDYCITYPYMKNYTLLNTICGGEQQAIRANMKKTFNTEGRPMIECSSYFKHNLKPGNFVTFYFYMPHYEKDIKTTEELKYWKSEDGIEYLYKAEDFDENNQLKKENDGPVKKVVKKDFTRYTIKVKVESLGDANGDNVDRIFSVRYENVESIYNYMNYFGCFYKKNNGNTDCIYYFRRFKKLTNAEGKNLKYDANKVAFAKNIYGDDITQILFMDDIDISGLLDHNGRPVSEIYLTVVKRNAGNEKWYGDDDDKYTSSDVEFSHCFGKVTSGIDFCGIENEPFDYNIHMLHNMNAEEITSDDVSVGVTFSAWGETILSGCPKTIENDIKIISDEEKENGKKGYDEFYGDVVEYDTYKATETTIGNIYHRFNTAQREIWNQRFKNLFRDEIVADDYDAINGSAKDYEVKTYYLNNARTPIDDTGSKNENLVYGNISPEGYFYNPHAKIQVRAVDDIETTSPAKLINYSKCAITTKQTYVHVNEDGTETIFDNYSDASNAGEFERRNVRHELTITSPTNYGFYKGDFMALYDKQTSDLIWGEIVSVSGLMVTISIDSKDLSMVTLVTNDLFDPQSANRRFYVYWSPNNTPTYAKLCEGSRKFVWRKIIPPSEMQKDNALYDTPFANGRFYFEQNINFFLKRQDPVGKYGLSIPMYKVYEKRMANPMTRFGIDGFEPISFYEIMYKISDLTNTCY